MFRKMRRFKQQLSEDAAVEILERNSSGTLAVLGDDGYPYAVPMSYVYHNGKLYFHSAKAGHKVDAIRNYEKVSFCVIDQDQVVPEKYTTYFRSAIAFGRMRFAEDEADVRAIATALAMKYSVGYEEGIPAEIDSSLKSMAIMEMTIEHLTAKEAIELIKMKNTL